VLENPIYKEMICPLTGASLEVDREYIVNKTFGIKYPVIDNIPVILRHKACFDNIAEKQNEQDKPKVLQVIKHFDERAAKYDEAANWVHSTNNLRAISCFLQKLYSKSVPLAIDLGGGTGALLPVLNSFAKEVVCVDVCLKMLQQGRYQRDVGICAEAEALPFKSEFCDLVIVRQAIHYFDFTNSLQEIKRVLKKNGMLILIQIVSPEGEAGLWIDKLTMLRQKNRQNTFTHSSIIKKVKEAGFKMVANQLWIDRSSTQSLLSYENNLKTKEVIMSFFNNASAHIKASLNFVQQDSHYSYNRYWSFTAFVRS